MSSIHETVFVEVTNSELNNAPEVVKQFLLELKERNSTRTTTPQVAQQPKPTADQQQAIQELVEAVPTTQAESIQEIITVPQDADDSIYASKASRHEHQERPHGSRKRSATEAITSAQEVVRDISDTELSKPRKQRKKPEQPSIPGLVRDWTGSSGSERFKNYIFEYFRSTNDLLMTWRSFTSIARRESVSVEYIHGCFKIYDELQKNSEFNRLLALILRIEILDIIERKVLEDPREVWVPKKLPMDLGNQIIPGLQKLKTNIVLSSWLSISRKYRIVRDWLPFIAKTSIIEKLQVKDLEQLCRTLNSCNQGFANMGKSFRRFILKQQSYLWEAIGFEALSKMPDYMLFHTITVRQFVTDEVSDQSQSGLQATGSKVEQYYCEFCGASNCEFIGYVQALISARQAELQKAGQHQDSQPSRWQLEAPMISDSLQTDDHLAEKAVEMGSQDLLEIAPVFRRRNFIM